MTEVTRKDFLKILGAGGVALTFAPALGVRRAEAWTELTPVRVPHPLPIYNNRASYYQKIDGTSELIPAGTQYLDLYEATDNFVVSPECETYIILKWGDLVFVDEQGKLTDDYFGYNNDFTAYVPIDGEKTGWLVVNHEYVSYPFHRLCPETPEGDAGYPWDRVGRSYEDIVGDKVGVTLPNGTSFAGLPLDEKILLGGEFLYNCGLSVVRIHLNSENRYVPTLNKRNRRVSGLAGLALNATRSAPYKDITSWGSKSYQQGNDDYLVGTGPAARDVFPLSTDGLDRKIIGTFANCSGAKTPWGTALSGEENFQGSSAFFVGVTETVKPDGTQTDYTPGTLGELFGMVGEKYGWVVEIDPASPPDVKRVKKHTALGRFRHENVAVRAEAGSKLIAYMGDDRRGGHWWKFVSDGVITDPSDHKNTLLFNEGTLYVARFSTDGTGAWIPLQLKTATDPNVPTEISSVQMAEQGEVEYGGRVILPLRLDTPAATGITPTDGGFGVVTVDNQTTVLPFYEGKKVRDFYPTLGAALCDAYPAANLVGGTPCARPEDCEVDPVTKKIYLSNTDARPGSDGYPDSRIFVVAKYTTEINAAQQFGDLIEVTETSADGTGLEFTWQRLDHSGAVGTKPDSDADALPGSGFGNCDNLVFGKWESLWVCIDQSTELHNGFGQRLVTAGNSLPTTTVDFNVKGGSAASPLIGIFGNNWLFYTPVSGPGAGTLRPFAIGPARCELTGPTFIGEHTLVVSVQHPGENVPIRAVATETQDRLIPILRMDGSATYTQTRVITKGSQWPAKTLPGYDPATAVPFPVVVGIKRKDFGPIV